MKRSTKARCNRCSRYVPTMPGLVTGPFAVACAHVDRRGNPCLDGNQGMPWVQGPNGERADAYLGRPGNYDSGAIEANRKAEWDL